MIKKVQGFKSLSLRLLFMWFVFGVRYGVAPLLFINDSSKILRLPWYQLKICKN